MNKITFDQVFFECLQNKFVYYLGINVSKAHFISFFKIIIDLNSNSDR